MNIWIINQHAVPLDSSGGTRHAVLAKYLARKGHNVTIFASFDNSFDYGEKKYLDKLYDGYKFRYIKLPQYKNVVERFFCMILFKRNVLKYSWNLEKPDIVIGSSVHLHAADAGRILAKRHAVPFIFEIRDIWPQTLIDIGGLSKLNPIYWYLRYVELKLLRAANKIISLLPGSSSYLNSHKVSSDKISYIPNGIDVELYNEIKPLKKNHKQFNIVFFGAHGPANNLDTLIEAAKILKEQNNLFIHITLIGDGVCKNNIIEKANKYKLTNITFLDKLPKTKLFENINFAHAFVFILVDMKVLIKYGVSANKLFDYMMCSRPVIFACKSFNNPISEASAGITADPNNPKDLANTFVDLSLRDEEDLLTMGYNGKRWVIANHDLSKLSNKLEDLLISAVNNLKK